MFNISSKYCFSLDKNSKKSLRLYLLLSSLEKYVNGATIEMRRLSRARESINKELRASAEGGLIKKGNGLTYLAVDTHFYFICIDKVYKLLSCLSTELNDSDIKRLAKELEKTFDIKTVRNHLEHIDSRCLGFLSKKDEKEGKRKHISDFGNYFNDSFTFDGKKFSSGKGSLVELKKIYNDLIKILTKRYASRDPGFTQRQRSEIIYKKIMKKIKKTGLLQN